MDCWTESTREGPGCWAGGEIRPSWAVSGGSKRVGELEGNLLGDPEVRETNLCLARLEQSEEACTGECATWSELWTAEELEGRRRHTGPPMMWSVHRRTKLLGPGWER